MWNRGMSRKKRSTVKELTNPDWEFHDLFVEVGAMGWTPPSNETQLRNLGFSAKEQKRIRSDLTLMARKCSYLIFRQQMQLYPFRINGQVSEDGAGDYNRHGHKADMVGNLPDNEGTAGISFQQAATEPV